MEHIRVARRHSAWHSEINQQQWLRSHWAISDVCVFLLGNDYVKARKVSVLKSVFKKVRLLLLANCFFPDRKGCILLLFTHLLWHRSGYDTEQS